nr:MAG TPA: hypothetical protein [Caudoviricetes sp.]
MLTASQDKVEEDDEVMYVEERLTLVGFVNV